MRKKPAGSGSPAKTPRNKWIQNEVLVKGRSQSAVWRQWNGLVKGDEKITRQRVHFIVARARKRLRLLVVVEPLVEVPA